MLKNGEQKQLMYGNYRGFDRRAFFDALVLANPKIIIPDSIYSYKIQRPSWAKRIRKKFGLDADKPPAHLPDFAHGRSVSFLPPSGKIYAVEQFMGGVSSFKNACKSSLVVLL